MQRRQFNTYLSTLLLSAALPSFALAEGLIEGSVKGEARYASASADKDQQHWLIVFNQKGTELARHPLPSRAHQVISHPTKPWVFVVARRPGQYLLGFDLKTGQQIANLTADTGQDFCGHMQISANGRYLYTTENISQTSEGLIGVRDIDANFNQIQSLKSGGIGPHQLKLNYSGDTLVVANGGIHTRDRVKLNLESMQSNLSYIDLATGEIKQKVALKEEYFQLSIRHIDINQHDQVLIAMQYQGAKSDQVPLVAIHQQGQPSLQYLSIPMAEFFQLKQYCGSACFDSSGGIAAISAPKGDRILFWDIAKNRYLSSRKVRDGCGITKDSQAQSFIVSSGRGKVYQINPVSGEKQTLLSNKTLQWDNHLASVG